MKIKSVEPFILHVPVTGSQIADSTHSITHWGVVGARIDTEDGLSGYGFTGTHAHLPGDQLITRCIQTCHAPLLIGEDAHDVQRLWLKLARNPALQWIGRAGITDIGWLSIADDKLVQGALQAVQQGFSGIKIKVGSTVERHLRRLEAVRQAWERFRQPVA